MNHIDTSEDEDEDLYGGIATTIKINPSEETKTADDAPVSSETTMALGIEVEGKENQDEDQDDEDDEDDEDDIAIVINDSKQAVRFTGGTNRYVRSDNSASGQASSGLLSPTFASLNGRTMIPELDNIPIESLMLPGGKRTAFDVDIEGLEDKPWRKPGVDISDYFNYGFDELSWKAYCVKQNNERRKIAIRKAIAAKELAAVKQREAEEHKAAQEKMKLNMEAAAKAAAASMTASNNMNHHHHHPGQGNMWPPPQHGQLHPGMFPPRGGPPRGMPFHGHPMMRGPPPPGWRGPPRGPPPPSGFLPPRGMMMHPRGPAAPEHNSKDSKHEEEPPKDDQPSQHEKESDRSSRHRNRSPSTSSRRSSRRSDRKRSRESSHHRSDYRDRDHRSDHRDRSRSPSRRSKKRSRR